ncbi:UNVERIFIED_CONTAM: hypothetical protein FKN15_059625 [Acipenser sinensis]
MKSSWVKRGIRRGMSVKNLLMRTGTSASLARCKTLASSQSSIELVSCPCGEYACWVSPSLLFSINKCRSHGKVKINSPFFICWVNTVGGAWIVTGGSHAGVMKHVGEAVRDYTMSSSSKEGKIVAIGIATWGIVHNRKCLVSSEGKFPAEYTLDEESQGRLSCLDTNHSHFILVDNGTHGTYGVEIALRGKLEKFICEQTLGSTDNGIKIPVVCVVLEGGPGTLNTIYSAMMNGTPCVVMEGSGRVADVIAQVANLPLSEITISHIQKQLKTYFAEDFKTFSDIKILEWTKKIQDIVRMQQLLTVFRLEKEDQNDVDVAILQALLKASKSLDNQGKENWDHQLKLAVAWNRVDIAKSEIFTDDKQWKSIDLSDVMLAALLGDKPDFVKLFLENGVHLKEFLTEKRLLALYNNLPPTSLCLRRILKKQEEEKLYVKKPRTSSSWSIQLYHVSDVLCDLLGGITKPLYPRPRDRSTHAVPIPHIRINLESNDLESFQNSIPMEANGSAVEEEELDPTRDLFIWAILENRKEIADIIWQQTLLTQIWWGELAVDTRMWKVLLCMFIFPLIYTGLITFRLTTTAFYEGRIILALDFNIWCLRLMAIFTVNKNLGPKIIIVKRMMKDIFFFLFLLAVWVLAYGVANQAILIHNEERLDWIIRGAVYEPYLTIFGQIPSRIDNTDFDISQCTVAGTDPLKPKCPVLSDNNQPASPQWITIILLCIYLLFANILLLNLLIAMFKRLSEENLKPLTRCSRLTGFYSSPVVVFYWNILSYFGFLWLFAYVLMIDFQVTPSWKEILLYIWLFTLVCEEIRQQLQLVWPAYPQVSEQELRVLCFTRGYTFQDVQDNTDKIWKFQRYGLIVEYHSQPPFPPPLIIFSHLHFLIERIFCKPKTHKQFKEKLPWNQETGLLSWEAFMKENYLTDLHNELNQSSDNKIRDTSEKVGMMVDFLERDKERQCGIVEKRLAHLEEQALLSAKALNWIMNALKSKGYGCQDEVPLLLPNSKSIDTADMNSTEESDDGSPQYHFNARQLLYPASSVKRFPVPDEKVPWEFATCIFRNPVGRTGLEGKGKLYWLGPNHALDPVITRWKRSSDDSVSKTGTKKVLEFFAIKRKKYELWAFPGGVLQLGETLPKRLKQLLNTKLQEEVQSMLGAATKVYEGYVDDPRNTDNAWVETTAINIHFDDTKHSVLEYLNTMCLQDSSTGISVRWQVVDQKIPLYGNHKEILQKVAQIHNAHY